MKLATPKKITPPDTPCQTENTPCPNLDGVDSFLSHMARAAGVTRKQIQFDMRVSATVVDDWFSGKKHDPVNRCRKLIATFPQWARAAILLHVAGDDFSGEGVSDQANAIARFAELVMGRKQQ